MLEMGWSLGRCGREPRVGPAGGQKGRVGGKIDTGLCQTETWAGARPAWRVDELIWDMWETKAGPGSPTDLGWRREEANRLLGVRHL